ncbi:MAG TPA: SDR family NAD(P)-dependent oxidoreductase [Acidimicrobiales bacterium]|nr:SDR family NAD(P)-dependent oxidoreductase [Acidimicrobiales bacterium]
MQPSGTALVTGASRGIGRAIAVELAARGFSVVATMRDPSGAPDLAMENLTVRRLDVTDVSTIEMPDDLRVLVNNAGFQDAYYPIEALPLERLRALMETNVVGQVAVMQRAIPVLRQRGEGVICTVTSSAVLMASPFFGAYRASKAAISAICESLYVELKPLGIRVLEVLPGPVDTRGLAHSTYIPAVEVPGYEERATQMMAGRERIRAAMVSPDAAAARIVDTILDDDAPLKSSCDPMGDAMLARWRESSDIDLLSSVLGQYTGH